MRLPGPIDERRGASFPPVVPIALLAVAVIGGVAFVATRGGDDDSADGDVAPSAEDTDGTSATSTTSGGIDLFDDANQLLGTTTVVAGSPLEVAVAGEAGAPERPGLAVITATASADAAASELSVSPCGAPAQPAISVRVAAGRTESRHLIVPVGANGAVCVQASADVELSLALAGTADPAVARPFPSPVRLLDSRADGSTDDGGHSRIGVRRQDMTTRVPIAARFSGLGDVGALVVSVSAADPLEAGDVRVFAPEASVPSAPLFPYEPGTTDRAVGVVPIGATGELCVATTGRTDLVVDVMALVPASDSYPILPTAEGAEVECPGQDLFPGTRIVAMYGTQRSARLGVLGEQPPADAVARMEEIAEPWRAGETPVLPAFELIATLATGTPEDRGVYNLRSSPEFVQEYLDVARRNGYYLILDLQTGQSDFLTEAKYYEEFLRQPDVGLALDPEWRTAPPARPRGGFIGTVDAPEVNAVVEYLAQLVEEEDLPEKLLVLHQFTEDMITNRDDIVELPGVAIALHMDGFGPRPEKLNSYDVVRADPPWDMGLKLFYDEDVDIFEAADVIGGAFAPEPVVITYQ